MGPEDHHDYGVIPQSCHRSAWASRELSPMLVVDFWRRAVKLPDREEKPEKLSISLWAQKGLEGIPELDSW